MNDIPAGGPGRGGPGCGGARHPAVPEPAAAKRDRRPDRAETGLPVACMGRSPTTRLRPTTTGAPTRPRTSTTGPWPTACSCARASSGASTSTGSASRASHVQRLLGRARLARESCLLDDLRAAAPPRGPARSPALRSTRRRAPGATAVAGAPRDGLGGQIAGQLQVCLHGLGASFAVPRVASRSAAESTVTSSSTGSHARM